MKRLIALSLLFSLVTIIPVTKSIAASYINPVSINPAEPDPARVKAAVEEFKSLSKKDRKARIKDARKELRRYKAARKAGRSDDDQVLLIILSILLPPLAVYLYEDEINSKFWISLLLTLIFWIPGVVYALLVVTGNA